MNTILKIISVVFSVLIFFNGCSSQSSQKYGQDFDQIKASKTRVSLGLTYLKKGDFRQAKFNLNKALEFAPRSADANFAMAYYYQNVRELEQAENTYQFAMDLAPRNANIANSYGAFLCQNGDYEKAKIYFFKAINTSNYISSAETYENLALCSRSQGQPEDAIHYLRSAVNHQPGRANSLFLLARSLVETHQWQEARSVLRRYEKTAQINPKSLLMAIKIEQGTVNKIAAKEYSDMLLNMFPNDPITKTWLTEQQPTDKAKDISAEKLSSNTMPSPAKKSFTEK
ncbi:MAG: type IV pilus assembly protein PilF [Flavobacteriales bacterium]|jgi:type IV pilus assembly protein PilF